MTIGFGDFYCQLNKEKQRFYFKKELLYYKDENGTEYPIFEFPEQKNKSVLEILQVLEYKHYAVIFLNWPIPRNILVADMKDKKILWQVPYPKISEKNNWLDYFIKDEKPDVIYCKAYRYVAGFKIPTGELVDEWFSKSADPRDF